jgi:hypothetical protein
VPELCVYAIASRRAGRITVRGVAGETLQAIPVGRLDAIVGRVRAVPAPTARNLRRFDRMMSALWRRTPALLPARFGTAARDAGDLRAMIHDREPALRRRLRAVRNRAQMTVRIVGGSGIGDRGLAQDDFRSPVPDPQSPVPNPRSTTRGRAYMRARQREQAVPAFDPLRASVRRWVRDERMEKRGGVASMYHLIPGGSAARYRAGVEHAAREAGLRVIVSGPWPPYAFADTW